MDLQTVAERIMDDEAFSGRRKPVLDGQACRLKPGLQTIYIPTAQSKMPMTVRLIAFWPSR